MATRTRVRPKRADRVRIVSAAEAAKVTPKPGAVVSDAAALAVAITPPGQPVTDYHRLIGQEMARAVQHRALALNERPEVVRIYPDGHGALTGRLASATEVER